MWVLLSAFLDLAACLYDPNSNVLLYNYNYNAGLGKFLQVGLPCSLALVPNPYCNAALVLCLVTNFTANQCAKRVHVPIYVHP